MLQLFASRFLARFVLLVFGFVMLVWGNLILIDAGQPVAEDVINYGISTAEEAPLGGFMFGAFLVAFGALFAGVYTASEAANIFRTWRNKSLLISIIQILFAAAVLYLTFSLSGKMLVWIAATAIILAAVFMLPKALSRQD